MMANE